MRDLLYSSLSEGEGSINFKYFGRPARGETCNFARWPILCKFIYLLLCYNYSSVGVEKPGVITKMNLTPSADHRVFDG